MEKGSISKTGSISTAFYARLIKCLVRRAPQSRHTMRIRHLSESEDLIDAYHAVGPMLRTTLNGNHASSIGGTPLACVLLAGCNSPPDADQQRPSNRRGWLRENWYAMPGWMAYVPHYRKRLRKTMSTNMSKAQLLAELQNEQAAWEALLSAIDDARMTEPGVAGDWSIKDIVAHLTGWRQRTVSRFKAALQHQPMPAPSWPSHLQTDDEINDWIYASNRDRSLSAILQEDRAVFQQLVDTLSAFPEAELIDPQRFEWLEGEPLSGAIIFGHFHEEHEQDIRAWLSNQP